MADNNWKKWYGYLMKLPQWTNEFRQDDMNLLFQPFRDNVHNILSGAIKQGLTVGVYETFRSPYRQLELFNTGKSKIRNGGAHQYGLATDIVFRDKKGNWTWEGDWDKLSQIMVDNGCESGHRWKSFRDSAHCQDKIYYAEVSK